MYCIYCGKRANYKFKNGKWCCSKSKNSCPEIKRKIINSIKGKKRSKDFKKRMSILMSGENNHMFGSGGYWKGKKRSPEDIKKFKQSHLITIKEIKKRYPFFYKVEDIKAGSQKNLFKVRCKNTKCKNSKENNGWFELPYHKIYERIRQLEKEYGNEANFLYCSDECKEECSLYNLRINLSENNNISETDYQTFRKFVLERDDHVCQFCGKLAIDVHHERPQILEPFFALDPDFAWACCKECHYKKGHAAGTECSTGSLANKLC